MYVLGIDVGTTGTKALLIDEDGNRVAKGYQGYRLITDSGGVIEQNPDDWWNAVVYVVKQVIKDVDDKTLVKALALSTQGSSSLLVDKDNSPLCNAISWMDRRATKERYEIQAIDLDNTIYKKTGWLLNESLDAAKLLWLKKNRKEMLKKAKTFISTIEYIHLKLTGENIIDPSNAAIRQLMNINTQQWDAQILDCIGVSSDILPAIAATGSKIGCLTKEAANVLGLEKTVIVYNGAHDQYCAALGVGAVNDGDMVLSTGTAWVTLGITKSALFTESFICPARHVIEGSWGALSSIPVAGAALEWFKKVVDDNYDEINKQAKLRMQNSKDLFFFSYFLGSKFPIRNEKAKATFIGLGLNHDRYDMFYAVMEGVVFQVKATIEEYEKNGAIIDTLRVAGGATKSDLWMSMIAAITDVPIYKSEEADAACLGAAAIAAVGEGIYKDYNEAVEILVKIKLFEPVDLGTIRFYKNKYARYTNIWKEISNIYN